MKYGKIVKAEFIDRPNRFIAHVKIDGKTETVHVKNTGRCRELLLPSIPVILEESDNPARKTRYDLITVWKEGIGWINMDSQAPNKVVKEWLSSKEYVTAIKPEYTFGKSRIDFFFEKDGNKCLMEVKGVTLEKDGICYFPDAPTERGVKHVHELMEAMKSGYHTYLAFVIQMNGVDTVIPNEKMHPEFAEVCREAAETGVTIYALGCSVTEDILEITRENIQNISDKCDII